MSIKRVRDIAARKDLEFWGGSTWVYKARIVNPAAPASQDMIWTIIPGEDNELEILYGGMFNGDTSARNHEVVITDDDGNWLSSPSEDNVAILNAGARRGFPMAEARNAATTGAASGNRYFVSGAMQIVATFFGVGAADDCEFSIVCRVRGERPATTEEPIDGTITVLKEKFF